ncbi:MAG TPA: DUF58 domain-containing protein [Cryomorphaceae bacterium]|nr:DUF58 domain-containing protein [Owenweeksia sp.]MBF98789.1 DUF58 domain-containing protein [Owenweeksia sp.]HAD98625.1 DUF58 domain-containing protein [Cryomorphaceae bacterium]HBF19394.1 DUF58 domain-containing protein [Cryomorphaceae bacterium]HCQ16178.1 DUF58 domain-containing protein [Cryomorphaceae bacterium]|tara:strand:+ start:6389 stop:7258 length:870 start_codon:yes stop_codon:yes gene_type:complete
MNTQELLKKVRRIEIKTRRLSNHLFSGEYHSSFKGRGMAFSEVRKYEYGDDIRAIDWNVTARLNEPYIKVFEEERELTLMLLVDVSGSGSFGSRVQMKRDMITEICATLAFSAIQNNDKVGVIFFSDKIEQFIPPKKGKTHTLRIIRELIELQPTSPGTNITEALRYFSGIQKKHAIAFVLSDFMDTGYRDALKIMTQRHDVTGIRIYDPREEELPNLGLLPMQDLETGKTRWVNTSSKALRQELKMRFEQNFKYFRESFTRSGAGQISIRIDESYPAKLLGYFKQKSA